MSLTVEWYPDLTATGNISPTASTFFLLGDATKGVLGGSYVLGGFVGVPFEGVIDIQTNRGRQSETDVIDVGGCTITLRNETRIYDPEYSGSPYAENIIPGRLVKVYAGDIPVWTGRIEEWNLSYTDDGESIATADCADALATVAAKDLDAFTGINGQGPGQRVYSVLTSPEVDIHTDDFTVEVGEARLQADSVAAGTNALEYLQLVTKSEQGYFYADADGELQFRGRATSYVFSPVTFTDDGSGIPWQAITVKANSTDYLYNRAVITRVGGTAQTEENADSIEQYGIRTFTLDGLLYDSDSQSSDLAEFIAATYGTPRYRITQLVVNAERLTTSELEDVCELEIGDLTSVSFTPNGIGDPIEKTVRVEGISHQQSEDSDHLITFDLSTVELGFVLDDDVLGVLDQNVLGY